MKAVIRNLDQLDSLATLRGRRGISQVSLAIPGQPAFTPSLETDINKSLGSCGCETGAMFVACGLVCLLAVGFRLHWAWSWGFFFRRLGVLLLLAFLGKVVGLATAQVRLGSAVRKLRSLIPAEESLLGIKRDSDL